jgi:hypothetical protein
MLMTSKDQNEPDGDTDLQADAMKDQLRKDVASWSAARSEEAGDPNARLNAKVVKRAAPAAPRPSRAKAKPVVAAEPVPAVKKPFKMSYDGTTDRDYIAHRINLGAR